MAEADFETPAGDDAILRFVLENADNDNLDGTIVRWRMAKGRFGDFYGTPLLSKSTQDGNIVIVDSATRTFDVTLTHADTIDLEGTYYHEAVVVLPDGRELTVAKGSMTVTRTLIDAASD